MSTTALKSWSEFVRFTDPLIWSLAMEGNGIAAEPENDIDTDISLHLQQRHDLVQQEDSQNLQQLQHMVYLNGSHTTSSPDSMPTSLNKNSNCCRSLLDPHSQNTLDWLKCLIQTSQDGNPNHSYKNQKERDPQLILDEQVDLKPVGEAISKRTRSTMKGVLSRSIDSDESTTSVVPPDNSLLASTKSLSNSSASNSLLSRSGNLAEGNTIPSFTGSSPNVQSNTSSNSRTSSSLQSTPAPVSLAVVAAAAVAAHRNAEAEARSKSSLEHHTFDHSSVVNAHTSNASNNTSMANAATATVAAATALVAPTNHNNNDGSTNNNSTIDREKITPSRFSFIIPTKEYFYSAAGVVQNGVIKSTDATTAFLYRTFSPTYRISRLYIDSFGDGSQKRGLERIKNSVVRGDALSLAKGTTTQMKDIWSQMKITYRSKKAKAKYVTSKVSASLFSSTSSSSSTTSSSTTSTTTSTSQENRSGASSATNSDSNSIQNTDNNERK